MRQFNQRFKKSKSQKRAIKDQSKTPQKNRSLQREKGSSERPLRKEKTVGIKQKTKQSNQNTVVKLLSYLSQNTNKPRRYLMECLKAGRVKVNGAIIRASTHPILPKADGVLLDGKKIEPTVNPVLYRFYKPTNVITTMTDPKHRPCVGDYVKDLPEAVFPVGRLDRDTTGLLLLTNDGQLAHQIMHPSNHWKKTYKVVLDTPLKNADVNRLDKGFILEDGPVQFEEIELLDKDELIVSIREGRNRIIRRSFAFLGYTVKRLKRLSVGPYQLGRLKKGQIDRVKIVLNF